jgi:hypothetical protein
MSVLVHHGLKELWDISRKVKKYKKRQSEKNQSR